VQYRVRDDDVEWRKLGGEVVILNLRTARYFTVNETGALLWPLLSEGAGPGRLVEELVITFGIERAVADRDVEAFLAGLGERGLVAVVAAADA
jgi:Coenzyme PQQ synthesis protein D (PqqD)